MSTPPPKPDPKALREAKLAQAAPEVAARVRFRRGDMAALNLSETFDAVICPYFGLAHLPAGAGWRNVFDLGLGLKAPVAAD